jgi:hypothetical protein
MGCLVQPAKPLLAFAERLELAKSCRQRGSSITTGLHPKANTGIQDFHLRQTLLLTSNGLFSTRLCFTLGGVGCFHGCAPTNIIRHVGLKTSKG